MKKILLFLWIILCLLIIHADELVLNGNFEKGLSPWKNPQGIYGKIKCYTLSQQTRFGKVCLQINGDPDNRYNGFNTLIQPLPKLSRDTFYLLQVQARPAVPAPEKQSVQVAVRQIDGSGRSLIYSAITLNLTEDTWRSYQLRFKSHKHAESYELYIISKNLNKGDRVYLDDISFSPEINPAVPFDPSRKISVQASSMEKNGIKAAICRQTGLLTELTSSGIPLQPSSQNSTVVFFQENSRETMLDGKNTPSADGKFRSRAEYSFEDGFFREKITMEALTGFSRPVKIGVRHGFISTSWKQIINALRPLRITDAKKSTIYSYGEDRNDLCLGDLDQYQHTAYPMTILENDSHWLLVGSRNLDRMVTISPNMPAGYFPSVQKNPQTIKKGERFVFELNWKLFPKKKYWLRDVWRYYTDHLQTDNKELKQYIPPRYTKERTFYPGIFGSHTYFVKAREDRLPEGSNVWFYSWHDNISERYPVTGSWWSAGNSWKEKIHAQELKKYVDYLQNEKHFNLIFYLRQLANLNQRGKEFPEKWFKRTPGGALHLYGGGYEIKLPKNVARETGYDKIPLGHFDFSNREYRDFYHQEILKVLDYYQPRAIGWDMGSNLDEFMTIARTYETIQQKKYPVKVTSNESAGPTQPYSDMVMLENGLLGGKSPYDFEITKAYTTAVVCLERFNLMDAALSHYFDGKKTWLQDKGLQENRRFLNNLLHRNPELKNNRRLLSSFCQVRFSLYDLSMGASPGYLEEAGNVPAGLLKMAADVNGLFALNRSFVLKLDNGLPVKGRISASAWQNSHSFRLVVYNDDADQAPIHLTLDCQYLKDKGWDLRKLNSGRILLVTPEGEKQIFRQFTENLHEIILNTKLPGFTALLLFAER